MNNEVVQFNPQSGIEIFTNPDKSIRLEVKLENETVWLTQEQMALLFGRNKSVISRHIRNIFDEEELSSQTTIAKFATVSKMETVRIKEMQVVAEIANPYKLGWAKFAHTNK